MIQIQDFQYDPQTQTLSFKMPFNWTFDNINQTSVVHEEITIPKTFGDLMVSSLEAIVNDQELSDYAITLDEFPEKTRLVHIVLNQNGTFYISREESAS